MELNERTILHLGCGEKYDDKAVNVDLVPDVNPDVVHHLDQTPWPFPDGRFQEVWAYDVIEHLDDIIKVMEEIHRVCADGAVVKITVPHYSCANAYTDITHRHYFGRFSFDYFTGDHQFSFYTRRRFRTQTARIVFYPTLTNKLVHRFANWFPERYERGWAWIFPAWFLYFELQVVKELPQPEA
ncbi:MAG: methyltransferase domain-containing protein [Gemmataceae bacterium]